MTNLLIEDEGNFHRLVVLSRPLKSEAEPALLDEKTRYAADAGAQTLRTVGTPCLILDQDRMDRNVARLRERMERLLR